MRQENSKVFIQLRWPTQKQVTELQNEKIKVMTKPKNLKGKYGSLGTI
jgi:hypothetical protein